jgi:sugar phosphate isomerase/epimerase
MKICLTTLGCPNWDLDTVIAKGKEYGFDGIDFRGLLDQIDITLLPEFTTGVASTMRKITDAGLEVSDIASSIKVCVPEARESNLEEARRTIEVARNLNCPNVRVFGGGDLDTYDRETLAKMGCDCMEEILALDGAAGLKWVFETHDLWIKAKDCKLLLDSIPNPAFGALWDMGHTSRVGDESPEESYAAIGPRIGHTHVKDAVYDPEHEQAMQDGWHYVLPGEGQLPLAEAIALLKQHDYDGWIMFEHEKRWHPDLQEPEVAFPAFVKWIRPLISD